MFIAIFIIVLLLVLALMWYLARGSGASSTTQGFDNPPPGVFGAVRGTTAPTEPVTPLESGGVVRMAYFYRPTCPYCVKYTPIWDEAVARIRPDYPDIRIDKYNIEGSDINRKLMEEATEGKYNTIPCVILWYSNGKKVFLNSAQRNHVEMYVRHTESK